MNEILTVKDIGKTYKVEKSLVRQLLRPFQRSRTVEALNSVSFSVADSTINMIKDTISSGEQISGVGYKTTSSYLNGSLKRGDTSTSVASVSTTTTTSSTTTSTSSGSSSSGGGY